MKLVESTPFDISEYCGNLIVTFLSEDSVGVQELFDFLDKNGYEYIKNEIGFHTLMKSSYLSGIEKLLESCGCYILYLTNNFAKKKNRVLRNNIFYQIGYLEARKEQIIVPFIEKGTKVKSLKLSETPIQQQNTLTKTSELHNTLRGTDERFRSIIMQNSFYENPTLNHLTKDRIEYRRLHVSLNITKENLEKAIAKYCSIVGDFSIKEDDFVNVLRHNLTCGAKIISFGAKSRMTTHLSPYEEEMHCINTYDFPTNFTCSHRYKKYNDENDASDLAAKYKLEIILPIHKLLGVNFKSFVKAKAPLTADVLEILFASNFTSNHDAFKSGNAIYFSLNFPNSEPFEFDHSLNIGSVADYLYPQ